ncbi:Protein VTS1 [Gigaspora margarita]|uniref:Protein VTS1 n=1 Tax=Gigaspora margarita TaxID=4874 RepID=A0A8H4B5H2_GIGMA|nr:Protein VTS1 [Gigaspora margarita]
MSAIRSVLNVARAKFFNVRGTGAVRIKLNTTKLLPTRSLSISAKIFQFSNATFIKPINSSFARSVTTESTSNNINENNTKPVFPHNKRRYPYTPEIAEVAIYNRIKWLRDNLYDRVNYNLLEDFTGWLDGCGMLRYSAVFEGMLWQDIIKLSRHELMLMGVKDIESAWRLGSCFWIIKCDLAMKEGKKLPYRGGKDRVNIDLKSLEEDFPAYLKTFDMEQYAPAFKDKNWREIIDMDYKDLKALGINSVNDRIKLIKNFWAIRRKLYHMERIEKCVMQPDKIENSNDSENISNT